MKPLFPPSVSLYQWYFSFPLSVTIHQRYLFSPVGIPTPIFQFSSIIILTPMTLQFSPVSIPTPMPQVHISFIQYRHYTTVSIGSAIKQNTSIYVWPITGKRKICMRCKLGRQLSRTRTNSWSWLFHE
jgi:hypothetical protein